MKRKTRPIFRILFFIWIVVIGGIFGLTLISDPKDQSELDLAKVDDPFEFEKRDRRFLKRDRWISGVRIYRDYVPEHYSMVYVAEMDRRAEDLRFGMLLAKDRVLGSESVSEMVQRSEDHAIAVVNAAFGLREDRMGRGGVFSNLHIEDRELVAVPVRADRWGYCPPTAWGEANFGVTDDHDFVTDSAQLEGKLKINGKSIPIHGINQIRDRDCRSVLYTRRFGKRTLTRGGTEIVLSKLKLPITANYSSKCKIDTIHDDGDRRIPSQSVILSIDHRYTKLFADTLREGKNARLEIDLLPKSWRSVTDAVGGNIRLLRNGEIDPELIEFHETYGGSAPEHENGARINPRSALAFNDQKLFLIVIDGRKSGYSIGMTFYDLAKTLRDLGATDAINFDGGSSSTLWAIDGVINRPSNGYERRVFNAAAIFQNR